MRMGILGGDSMNIGKLNKRITIQQFTTTDDGMGGQIEAWEGLAAVWANVDTLKMWESFKAQAVEANITHKITIRYRKGLSTKMRIKYGDRIFNITSIIDKEEKHISLELLCVELVQNGGN